MGQRPYWVTCAFSGIKEFLRILSPEILFLCSQNWLLVFIIFVCRRIRIYTWTWYSCRYIFLFFFHIRLGCQAAFCVRLFPLMLSMHFLSVLCHVLLMTRKLTLSMIYVTWLPHFWTFLRKVRENSYYKVASWKT